MRALIASLVIGCGCGVTRPHAPDTGGDAQVSRAADSAMLTIAAGDFIAGSTTEERERAYQDYRDTAGHDAARPAAWFAREQRRHPQHLRAFRIDQTPVTNAAYAEFVEDTNAEVPYIDAETWAQQGFIQDYTSQVVRFNWDRTSRRPPAPRRDHPAVLITWTEAARYCAWRGRMVGSPRRLPTELEFERAARGPMSKIYPWGNDYDVTLLNSADAGPRDTVAVGSYPAGASDSGMLDAAGNVFQWTATPWPSSKGSYTVKGSAWDDHGGLGRGAARHGRRAGIRHVIVGFRCAGDR